MSTKNIVIPNKMFKNRINIAYSLMFLIMWIFFGWNTSNADFLNYKHIYETINYLGGYPGVEVGFETVVKISNFIGLEYNSFLIAYSLIGLLLISSTIRKYSRNKSLVLILYIIYPFFLDIVQIRSYMAMAIMVYSIRFLVNDNKLSNLKYIVTILIASSFHYLALFYLLFLFSRIDNLKKILTITIVTSLVGFLMTSVFSIPILEALKLGRYRIYFASTTSLYSKLLFIFYFISSTSLNYFIYNKIKRMKLGVENKPMYFINDEQMKFADLIMKINILILSSYVFVYLDVDFVRIFRNILPLNYILFSIIKPSGRYEKNINVFLHSWLFFSFVILSSFAFIYYQTFDTVVLEILTQNSFWEVFRK